MPENLLKYKTLVDSSGGEITAIFESLKTSTNGISEHEAKHRIKQYGLNEVLTERRAGFLSLLLKSFNDPLIILLMILAAISFFIRSFIAVDVILIMIAVSISLRIFREAQADSIAKKLKAMVKTTATVIRDNESREIPLSQLVPGDVIHLSAGDMIPADVRIIISKDLFVNQVVLTGESLPVEKHAHVPESNNKKLQELTNIGLMGTNIESGTASALVILTGKSTYFGSLASGITKDYPTSFDRGINEFTWLMIRFILVMVPLVFIINGITKASWLNALLFALAIGIGLTPEMLPMIVTVNLSKGAMVMFRKKVVVKKLSAIQNFGAMDILCTDKTGTITQGRVILEKHIDVFGNEENEQVLKLSYINSFYQTGLKSILDKAVLEHAEIHSKFDIGHSYAKIDEVTFDFIRKRMSVIVEDKSGKKMLICKGAVEGILSACNRGDSRGVPFLLEKQHISDVKKIVDKLNREGFRVIAVAYKETPPDQLIYSIKDENELILAGFIAFLDPPKETALKAINSLRKNGVEVKILTGDNEIVTKKVCSQVKLPVKGILLGDKIDSMPQDELESAVENVTIFARLLPSHKEKIIRALQHKGHTVGFLGDGINDAPALKVADVSMSVDTAVDIAKESSSIILLEKSLLVLEEGVLEGRKVFGNIIKYIRMASSSNFGNMLSLLGSSIFLPFLPMLPIQILINNMLYDLSQTTIPRDNVDREYLIKPRQWRIDKIKKFILYIGPVSSIFDYITFIVMIYFFSALKNPSLFQTGWFVESLVTQTLIIHIIRTDKIPFFQSRASTSVVLTTLLIIGIGIWLPYSIFANELGLMPLPMAYWIFLALNVSCYIIATHFVKVWFVKKYAE